MNLITVRCIYRAARTGQYILYGTHRTVRTVLYILYGVKRTVHRYFSHSEETIQRNTPVDKLLVLTENLLIRGGVNVKLARRK
jgi:hypothetical protein